MINPENRLDEYAYRMSGDVDSTVTTLQEGQWLTYNAAGKFVIADGTTARSFPTISSKRTGRDQLSGKPIYKAVVLVGNFKIVTDQYYTSGTYATTITALKLMAGGIVTNWISGTDNASLIVGYAIGQPVGGKLTIIKD